MVISRLIHAVVCVPFYYCVVFHALSVRVWLAFELFPVQAVTRNTAVDSLLVFSVRAREAPYARADFSCAWLDVRLPVGRRPNPCVVQGSAVQVFVGTYAFPGTYRRAVWDGTVVIALTGELLNFFPQCPVLCVSSSSGGRFQFFLVLASTWYSQSF